MCGRRNAVKDFIFSMFFRIMVLLRLEKILNVIARGVQYVATSTGIRKKCGYFNGGAGLESQELGATYNPGNNTTEVDYFARGSDCFDIFEEFLGEEHPRGNVNTATNQQSVATPANVESGSVSVEIFSDKASRNSFNFFDDIENDDQPSCSKEASRDGGDDTEIDYSGRRSRLDSIDLGSDNFRWSPSISVTGDEESDCDEDDADNDNNDCSIMNRKSIVLSTFNSDGTADK